MCCCWCESSLSGNVQTISAIVKEPSRTIEWTFNWIKYDAVGSIIEFFDVSSNADGDDDVGNERGKDADVGFAQLFQHWNEKREEEKSGKLCY